MKRTHVTRSLTAMVLGALALSACQTPMTQMPAPGMMPRNPIQLGQMNAGAANNIEQRLLVGYQGALSQQKIQQLEQQTGGRFVRDIPQIGVAVFEGVQLRGDMSVLTRDPQITFAGPDQSPRRIVGEPEFVNTPPAGRSGDPMLDQQWALKAINAQQAWSVATGKGVKVAVVDTGVDLVHPDLQNNIIDGYNAEQPGTPPTDGHYHGTHVAGIIAAEANNGQGIAGVAPSAKIMPVRAISRGSVPEVAAGIIWAADNGARAINLSLGWDFPSASVEETIKRAVKYALDKNVVILAALSNSAQFNPRSVPDNLANKPGFEGVVGVGNVDVQNRRQGAFGDWKSVSSPGTQIMSTLPNNRYGNLTGTSMATPAVAGLVALMLERNPNLSNVEVKQRLMGTAVDLGDPGYDPQFGAGLISAPAALGLSAQIF